MGGSFREFRAFGEMKKDPKGMVTVPGATTIEVRSSMILTRCILMGNHVSLKGLNRQRCLPVMLYLTGLCS